MIYAIILLGAEPVTIQNRKKNRYLLLTLLVIIRNKLDHTII